MSVEVCPVLKLELKEHNCKGMINIYGQLVKADLQPLCCLACDKMEGNRPTLKQLFSKENLTSYIEATRTKTLFPEVTQ